MIYACTLIVNYSKSIYISFSCSKKNNFFIYGFSEIIQILDKYIKSFSKK